MVKQSIIHQIKEDFRFTAENPAIKGVILYGSHATGDETPRSDIDICIVVPGQDLCEMYSFIMRNLENNVSRYDVRFFEELPLHIQAHVIERGILVLSPDTFALYEYFYAFRKLWADVKYRMQTC